MYFPINSGYTYREERKSRMLICFIRTLILFVVIIFGLRLMGKRQIGQLQPAELVITILLSEIAATPMQDNDISMLNSVVAIMILVSLEIIMSAISLKSMSFRGLLQGNSIVIIKDGVIDPKQMKRLRFTLDDLLEALRQKDVFDLSEVQYAVAETDGTLSVLLKESERPVTRSAMGLKNESDSIPSVVIMDGKRISAPLFPEGAKKNPPEKILKTKGLNVKDIFFMSVTSNGKTKIIEREKKQ